MALYCSYCDARVDDDFCPRHPQAGTYESATTPPCAECGGTGRLSPGPGIKGYIGAETLDHCCPVCHGVGYQEE